MFEILNENPMDVTSIKVTKLWILEYCENTESLKEKPCYNNNTRDCYCELYVQGRVGNALCPASGQRTVHDGVTQL